jgi:LEA14-like dessication related protein
MRTTSVRAVCSGLASSVGTTAVVALFAVAMTTGCATTDALEEMEITLTDLQFTEATLFETTMVAKIRVTNPNPDPLAFEGASFKLYLDDRKVGTGLAPDPFSTEGLDTTIVPVTFYLNNATALLRVVDVLKDKREVGYGVKGSLFMDSSWGRRKLKVEKMGSLDIENLEVPEATNTDKAQVQPGEF